MTSSSALEHKTSTKLDSTTSLRSSDREEKNSEEVWHIWGICS